jgi:hypothetical protein
MTTSFKVNTKEVERLLDKLDTVAEEVIDLAYPILKNNTPVRQGNARNKTKKTRYEIKSDYPYAGRLDEGWSKQAPKGFTAPTQDRLDNLLSKVIRSKT